MPSPRPRRSAPRAAALLLPVLLPLVLLVTGCSGLAGTGDLEYVGDEGRVVEFDAGERERPVGLSGETTTGEAYTWEPGTVTVVNIWWSGCGPCIREMPLLTELDEAYGDQVEFLGINIRDTSAANALAFERDRGVDYPSLYEPEGNATLFFPGRTSPRATPTTYVIDTEGEIASLISGEIPSRTTLTELVEAAGGPPAPEPASTSSGAEGTSSGAETDG